MATIYDRLKNPRGTVYLHELLKEASAIGDKKERIALLQLYAKKSPAYAKNLQFFVEVLHHPQVKMDLPPGIPPYRELDAADESMAFTNLFRELTKIGLFCQGSNKYVANQLKREKLFVQMLEALCPREAKLLLMLKDKKLDKRVYPLLTEAVFRDAFPQWFPPEEPKEDKAKNV